ncbi:MAG: aminopeptidase [Candidatus Lokiarchaeia archaeon]
MSSEFEQNLEKYAEVIIKVALNLQSGQKLCIFSPFTFGVSIELAPLIRLITKKAYQIGARFVEVMWYDEKVHLTRFQHAPLDTFTEFPKWKFDFMYNHVKGGNPVLLIIAHNPDLLIGQDLEKLKLSQQTYFKGTEQIVKLNKDHPVNSTYIACAIDGWANKVFPNLPLDKRKEKLWDMIFEMCRVKSEDPILAWQDHINRLKERSDYLTKKHYIALKYSAPGTNLTIGLPKDHIWRSGAMTTKSGIEHPVNVPTEEVFTTPHYKKTEGFVTSTKPLNYAGSLIEDLKFEFSEGKIVKATAKRGEEDLQNLISIDEGASYLGEVALVPHSSPISKLGILFFNTLIDENASCHIAFGRGIRFSIKNGQKMSDEEFTAAGGNISKVHIDFMIGSGEIDIDGVLDDGTVEPVMINGEWVFEV